MYAKSSLMHSSAQTPTPRLATFRDLLTIPEDQRFHEILDGLLVEKAMASGEHGTTQGELAAWLITRFRGQAGDTGRPGGWWFATEVQVELARHQVLRPDLAGWRRDRMPNRPHGYPQTMRPDWVCEVQASGDSRRRDGMQKLRIYADHAVPHYWLVDAERERLTILRLTDNGYVEILQAGRGELVRAEPFDAVELQVGLLFGDDV